MVCCNENNLVILNVVKNLKTLTNAIQILRFAQDDKLKGKHYGTPSPKIQQL